jgi:hypothetical protein
VRLLLRLVVVTAVLLAMLVIAAELLAKPFAERAVAGQVRDERGLADTPEVELSGFPFLLSVARGHLDEATVAMDRYVVDGLVLRQARLELDGVGFSLASLANGDSDVEAERATIVADVVDADLNSWLATRGIPVTVRFAQGVVEVTGQLAVEGVAAAVTARGSVAVDAGVLHFEPAEVALGGAVVPEELAGAALGAVSFTVPLPEVAGAQVTGATVGDGSATLVADVTDYLLAGA